MFAYIAILRRGEWRKAEDTHRFAITLVLGIFGWRKKMRKEDTQDWHCFYRCRSLVCT